MAAFFGYSVLYSQEWLNNVKDRNNFYEIQKAFNDYWKGREIVKGEGYKQFKRWEDFWAPRVYPSGKFPSGTEVLKSYLNFREPKNQDNLQQELPEWKEVGPDVVPTNKLYYKSSGAGRLNVIRIHPKNDNIIWVGAAGGGAWKSTNKGKSWVKKGLTDILSLGVGDIAISESNPDIMYIATGDDNGYFQEDIFSVGVMKSIDGGETWSIVGFESNTSEQFIAARILIDPKDENIVYLGSSRGLFKTIDGGENWVKKSDGFFREMEFKPGDPNTIYAATSGLRQYNGDAAFFKTTDAGETWSKVLQNVNVNRYEIGVTPKNPDYVYILGALRNSGSYAGVWRSKNSGENFELMSSSPNILGINADGSGTYGQGFYDLAIAVSPVNENQIYIGGIHIWRSNNEGRNWELINHWTGSNNKPYVHADQHYLLFNPNNLELYSANDGGLYLTSNNGVTWTDLSNGLGIMQLYRIAVAQTAGEKVSAGAQDNGTQIVIDGEWYHVSGGDGMHTEINPKDDKIVYCSSQNGSINRSTNGGLNFNRIIGPDYFDNEAAEWVTPFALNPQNPSTMLVGFRDIYKSTNRGSNWAKISNFALSDPIDLIAYAPSDSNIIYFTQSSSIYVTYNGGKSWQSIGSTSNFIRGLAVDYDDPNRFWVTISGYNATEKVYEYYGQNRTNITFNLPNMPVNTIVTVKGSSGKLIVGTDAGVFLKNPANAEWQKFSKNLPPVVVTDLRINYATGKLYAGTFGRGIWVTEIYSCNIAPPKVTVKGPVEFCQGDSVKLSLEGDYVDFAWSNGDTTREITIFSSGSYYVNVSDESGCSARSEVINVEVKQVPSFTINAENNGIICGNGSVQLTLPLGLDNYLWNNGETNRKIDVSTEGTYFATAFAKNGCYLVSNKIDVKIREIPAKPTITQDWKYLITELDSTFKYQWYSNGKKIADSDTNVIEPKEPGDYYVEITSEFGCKNQSDVFNVVSSIQDESGIFSWKINPNPSDGKINLSLNGINSEIIVNVSDNTGRKLFSQNVVANKSNNVLLDLSNFSNGSYIITFIYQGKTYNDKIIIKK